MGLLEVILLLGGVALAVITFVVPAAKEELPKETKKLAKDEIRTIVGQEMDTIRNHVDDVVDEAVEYAMEKTERSLERLTNEKIMAVNEYSDTVLREIQKNHEEAMFLYDMLNAKHTNLKNTVSEVNKTVQEAAETKREAQEVVSTFQKLKPEATEEQAERVQTNPAQGSGAQANAAQNSGATTEHGQTESAQTSPQSPVVMQFMAAGREPQAANSNDRILELYKQGKSKVAIAKELGLGVGEVKLVIDLFKSM
ncbi:MAG: hypothetical protein IJ747_03185 [Lachnospiraceae bacterium]|nr:hypothetical protein [Lachnospiraceae bacterium]